jgi:hypothetical protein
VEYYPSKKTYLFDFKRNLSALKGSLISPIINLSSKLDPDEEFWFVDLREL